VFEATADGSRGIADASVMFGKDRVTLSASTGENGEFSLEGITAGTWQLFIAKEGYETQIIVVEVQANKSLEVELKAVMNQ
jgi:Carboxypeptidase regulatory-like domain